MFKFTTHYIYLYESAVVDTYNPCYTIMSCTLCTILSAAQPSFHLFAVYRNPAMSINYPSCVLYVRISPKKIINKPFPITRLYCIYNRWSSLSVRQWKYKHRSKNISISNPTMNKFTRSRLAVAVCKGSLLEGPNIHCWAQWLSTNQNESRSLGNISSPASFTYPPHCAARYMMGLKLSWTEQQITYQY